jgi:hypothetical protein
VRDGRDACRNVVTWRKFKFLYGNYIQWPTLTLAMSFLLSGSKPILWSNANSWAAYFYWEIYCKLFSPFAIIRSQCIYFRVASIRTYRVIRVTTNDTVMYLHWNTNLNGCKSTRQSTNYGNATYEIEHRNGNVYEEELELQQVKRKQVAVSLRGNCCNVCNCHHDRPPAKSESYHKAQPDLPIASKCETPFPTSMYLGKYIDILSWQ